MSHCRSSPTYYCFISFPYEPLLSSSFFLPTHTHMVLQVAGRQAEKSHTHGHAQGPKPAGKCVQCGAGVQEQSRCYGGR